MNLLTRIIWGILSLLMLVSFYIYATTNAIGDSYKMGIANFKYPFFIYTAIIFYLSLAGFLGSIFFKSIRNYTLIYAKILFGASFIVLIFNYVPCIDDSFNVSTATLIETVKHSLCCPSYSNRSTIAMIFFIFISSIMYLISKKK